MLCRALTSARGPGGVWVHKGPLKQVSAVADAPSTASWDHVAGRAKQSISTVIPEYVVVVVVDVLVYCP